MKIGSAHLALYRQDLPSIENLLSDTEDEVNHHETLSRIFQPTRAKGSINDRISPTRAGHLSTIQH